MTGRGGQVNDERPVEQVFDAASKRLGEILEPAIVRNLAKNGVKWAWQLAELNDANWGALSVPIGLQTAVRAELAYPTKAAIAKPEPTGEPTDERKRRFLLMPDASGQPAKPLGQMSALFLGLLPTPIGERQNLMLALCELLALISGLFLSIIPGNRRAPDLAPAGWLAGWDVPPTLEDIKDALRLLAFGVDISVIFVSVLMALAIAASGYHADDRFCELAMSVLGALFLSFIYGAFVPSCFLVFFYGFTDAARPYAVIGSVIGFFLFFFVFLRAPMLKFFAEAMALEMYHTPRRFKNFLKLVFGGPCSKHLLGDKLLRSKAEIRASKHRVQLEATHAV